MADEFRERLLSRRFRPALGLVLFIGLALRMAYLALQPLGDPAFSRPMLDGAYYLEWAGAIASGRGGFEGAYYLGPLFAYGLAAFLAVFGENFSLLYLLQHLLIVSAAGMLALHVRPSVGAAGALAGSLLFVLYHPLTFFASRPLSEPLALALLAASLLLTGRETTRATAAGGLLVGLSALARPNLLLVAAVWVAGLAAARRFRAALALAAGLALATAPVMIRNYAVSGHPVPISSNAGITAYHGNGPGAVGVFTHPRGFVGELRDQRDEATRIARARSGQAFDAVEADRWWGRQALATRLEHPGESLLLLLRRGALLLDSHEHGLDYAPALDANPLRRVAWIPFGLLFGLAAAGVVLRGFRRSGGAPVWATLVALALTPLLFYVSSRYRLPLSALLTVPAGAGLAALFDRAARVRLRLIAATVGAGCLAFSLAVPSQSLRVSAEASSRANLAGAYKAAGDLSAAETEARRAIGLDPRSLKAHFNLGVILEASGQTSAAEASYRKALRLDGEHPAVATNLSGLLIVRGAPAEAIEILQRALAAHPRHEAGWTNLVIALVAGGQIDRARETLGRSAAAGVHLDPALVDHARRALEGRGGPGE